MEAKVYKYQTGQKYWYRGYVREYKGNLYRDLPCEHVRRVRGDAMADAKKMLRALKPAKV